jgi:hypothetical protein
MPPLYGEIVAPAAISGIPQNPTHSAFDSPEIESFTRAFSVAGQLWNCARLRQPLCI